MNRRARAFTLIETIAVMMIVGTIGAVFSTVLFSAADSYSIAADSRRGTEAVASALEQITHAVRDTPLDDTGAAAIAVAGEDRIEFVSGLILEFIDNELQIARPDQNQAALLTGIEGHFTLYSDGPPDQQELDWATITSYEQVRMVGITLDIDGSRVTTRVLLRNTIGGDS